MPFGFDFGEEKVLETISIGYLYPGMVAQDDIYNYNGKLLLVAKGITLTDTLISRLKNFNDSQHNIKVSSEVRRELVNRGIPKESKQKKFENTTGYSALKTETENMLTVSQVTDSVPYQQASDAGKSVIKRIDVTDPAELFQCINAGNEVDEYLYRHSTNVAIINGLMAKWLGFGKRQTQELVLLGLVHDVGKTRIPSQILDFPGKLGEDDYELVKKHPVYSQEMISNNINFNEDIKKGVRHHHERMNGEGYPDGLRADDIPLYSRITAVSDVYDAMVSRRTYKNAQSPFRVLLQLQTDQYSGLDIKLVKLFTELMPRELVGKTVLMSNGAAATVRHVNEYNIEYPVVEIDGEVMPTNENLYCLSMMMD